MDMNDDFKKRYLLFRSRRRLWRRVAYFRARERRRKLLMTHLMQMIGVVVLFVCVIVPFITACHLESQQRPTKKRRWTLDRTSGGFLESQVQQWPREAWDAKYIQNFRVDYSTFRYIVERYGHCLEREDPQDKRFLPCSVEKRVGIVLNWLATGDSQHALESRCGALLHKLQLWWSCHLVLVLT
jgi:hypothetical protein